MSRSVHPTASVTTRRCAGPIAFSDCGDDVTRPAGSTVACWRWATTRTAASLAAVLTAAVLCIAILVHLAGLGGRVARILDYRFGGLAARPAVALAIFGHNARALLGIAALLLIAQTAARRRGGPARAQRALLLAGEALLAAVVALNVLVVGGALGAYGQRMARALLPHGPLELAAFTLMLALHLHGRHQALSPLRVLTITGVCLVLLGVAAATETFL